jgi:hypothetical protein
MAIAVTAGNAAFVTWWVGDAQYGGPVVTLLAVVAMLIRHSAWACWNAAYILGYERRIAIVLLLDGVATVGATVLWTAAVGLAGAPLGSLTGAVLVYGPIALFTIATAMGVSSVRVLAWVAPLAIRFVAVFVPVVMVLFSPGAASPWVAGGAVLVGTAVYSLLLYNLAANEPLRPYRDRVVAAVRRRLGRPALR